MIDIVACLIIGYLVTEVAGEMAGVRRFNVIHTTVSTLSIAGGIALVCVLV